MSFGFSVGDFVTITQLAWTTYRACRNAGSEYRKLSHEVKSLHLALDRLKEEAERSGSLVRLDIERHSRKTRRIWRNCSDVLKEVDGLIVKHESLGMSKKKLWDRLQFGAKDLGDIRSKIAAHTNVINVYIGIVGLSSLGRLEQQSHINSDKLLKIQMTMDKLATEFRAGKREGTISTTSSKNHKETWRAFRRSLLSNGITSHSLTRYGPEIKAYLIQLTKNGMLDEQAYDSDGIQDEVGNEPTINHFLGSPEIVKLPIKLTPSAKTDQIFGMEILALPQPDNSLSTLTVDAQHPLTASAVAEIPCSNKAPKFTLSYRGEDWQDEQSLNTEPFPPFSANKTVPQSIVELASSLSQPTVNQSPSKTDASLSSLLFLRHHAEDGNPGLDPRPSTHSVENISPPDSTIDETTRPAIRSTSVIAEATSDESSETSSVKEKSLSLSHRSVPETKQERIAEPAIEPESNFAGINSGEMSMLEILYARHEPSVQREYTQLERSSTKSDSRPVVLERIRPKEEELAKRERFGKVRMFEEIPEHTDSREPVNEETELVEEMTQESAQKMARENRMRFGKMRKEEELGYATSRARIHEEEAKAYQHTREQAEKKRWRKEQSEKQKFGPFMSLIPYLPSTETYPPTYPPTLSWPVQPFPYYGAGITDRLNWPYRS